MADIKNNLVEPQPTLEEALNKRFAGKLIKTAEFSGGAGDASVFMRCLVRSVAKEFVIKGNHITVSVVDSDDVKFMGVTEVDAHSANGYLKFTTPAGHGWLTFGE